MLAGHEHLFKCKLKFIDLTFAKTLKMLCMIASAQSKIWFTWKNNAGSLNFIYSKVLLTYFFVCILCTLKWFWESFILFVVLRTTAYHPWIQPSAYLSLSKSQLIMSYVWPTPPLLSNITHPYIGLFIYSFIHSFIYAHI